MYWNRKLFKHSPAQLVAKSTAFVFVIVVLKGCALLPEMKCDVVEQSVSSPLTLQRGDKAPAFSLQDLAGNDVAVYDIFTKHKRVLVSFWGSWCAPCLRKLPAMKDVYEKFTDDRFEMVGVALEKHWESWTKISAQYDVSWKNLVTLDSWESNVLFAYGVSKVPTNFLVDSTGCIRRTDIPLDELEKVLTAVYGLQND